ncbi:MAG TPA: hypothetical protein PKK00_14590 [Bacteroidales bacterium]|nr:hypothetical protein [Bacteroidales bacterium]HPS17556.1 hypothetical protein [Bacteroidales bacterium]
MKTNETGHAKNVANFEQLISFCTGYGATYNPAKAALKLTALNTLFTTAQTSLATVKDKFNAYSVAVDAREILFNPLSKFTTRVLSALESSEVTVQKIDDAKTITRKITGKRATQKKEIMPLPRKLSETQPEGNTISEEIKQISASQMSYDNRLDNFAKLINLLSTETGYIPNETDLKVTALNTMLASMKAKNTAVINTITALSNARIDRNKIFYKENIGLYDIAMDVKVYVKSVYGSTSPEYKEVSGIKFTKTA